jgi:hypothetical protein
LNTKKNKIVPLPSYTFIHTSGLKIQNQNSSRIGETMGGWSKVLFNKTKQSKKEKKKQNKTKQNKIQT